MINQLGRTSKEILINDVWVIKHIQAIATDAVAYQTENLKDHVDKLINSNQVHHLITYLAWTVCNGHAAAALDNFAETDKPDDDEKETKNNTKKSDEIKIFQRQVRI